MVLPDEEAEQHHAEYSDDPYAVAPEGFPGEDRHELEQDAEPGQGEDVHLRMPEEPEEVLEQVAAASGARYEERRLHSAVEADHQEHRDQHRRGKDHQNR